MFAPALAQVHSASNIDFPSGSAPDLVNAGDPGDDWDCHLGGRDGGRKIAKNTAIRAFAELSDGVNGICRIIMAVVAAIAASFM
jgi:hypothetical protein